MIVVHVLGVLRCASIGTKLSYVYDSDGRRLRSGTVLAAVRRLLCSRIVPNLASG